MMSLNNGIFSTVGRTPLVRLKKLYPDLPLDIYAKLEMFNPGGSIKDRPARLMLSRAIDEGKINSRSTIIESSSGNMAIGLAQACRYLDLNLIVVVDPKINDHTQKILQTYGAEIDMVTEADGHGNYLAARLNRVQELLETRPDSYWPNQYANPANPAAQFQTMHEIAADLAAPPDYLLAATSTCGTVMGCANYIKQNSLDTKVVAVDAKGSVIFNSLPATRLVPGHGAGRPSELLEREAVDQVLHMSDEECVIGCRRLLEREAILAGGSSGALVMALEKLPSCLPRGSSCAIVLADSGERYLNTVYNDAWVEKHFDSELFKTINQSAPITIPASVISDNNSSSDTRCSLNDDGRGDQTIKIAIIGGGPKGTFGFERLAAQFKEFPPSKPIEIHVYNTSPHFGSGQIYDPAQPSYLLINNPVGDINMWIDEKPAAVAKDPLSLTDWLIINKNSQFTASDYCGRNAVGRYLIDGFQKIAANLPEDVRGKYLVGEVTDILRNGASYEIRLKNSLGRHAAASHRYDHILLATGHPKNRFTKQDARFESFANRHSHLHHVPFIYPVDSQLNKIAPRSNVAVKGLGLTFTDAVLALTEGRGGTFDRNDQSSKLSYRPSGNEPEAIYPFSRSGLPMMPRKPAPASEASLKFFKLSALKKLQKKQADDKLDFREHIWPLLKQEYLFAFYNAMFKKTAFKENLTSCDTFAEVKYYISAFHRQHTDATQFNPEHFLRPLYNKNPEDTHQYHRYIKLYLSFYLREAQKGIFESPWAAAASVWRKATPTFCSIYNFGGLTPSSQQYFDDKFRRLLNRISFGPPIESVEKIMALMDAGILRFNLARNPAVKIDEDKQNFVLKSTHNIHKVYIDALVDARIAGVSIKSNQSPLYRHLLRRGLIRLFRNTSCEDSYAPGCLSVTARGFVIGRDGKINKDIAVTGTPAEGITFDNDALSRIRNNFVSGWAASIRKLYAEPAVKKNQL